MECCVKHCYLRHFRHEGSDCVDTGHVGGVVEGGKVIALFDHVLDLIGDKYALAELFCSVYHTMSYSIDLSIILYASFNRIREEVENSFYRTVMVGLAKLDNGF